MPTSLITPNTLTRNLPSDLLISSATESVYDLKELEKAKQRELRRKNLKDDDDDNKETEKVVRRDETSRNIDSSNNSISDRRASKNEGSSKKFPLD